MVINVHEIYQIIVGKDDIIKVSLLKSLNVTKDSTIYLLLFAVNVIYLLLIFIIPFHFLTRIFILIYSKRKAIKYKNINNHEITNLIWKLWDNFTSESKIKRPDVKVTEDSS